MDDIIKLIPVIIPITLVVILPLAMISSLKKIQKKYYQPVTEKILSFQNRKFFSEEEKNKAKEDLKKELLTFHDDVRTGNSKLNLKVRHWILRQIMSL